jgi:hypothetical protein
VLAVPVKIIKLSLAMVSAITDSKSSKQKAKKPLNERLALKW